MAKTLTIPIGELLPHDPPMILIDRMLEADETSNLCEVVIKPSSMFLEDKGVPVFVAIEYMAQAIAAHAGYSTRLAGGPVKVGFLLGTPRFNAYQAYFPLGTRYQVRIERDWGDDELMRFNCSITRTSDDCLFAEAGLNVFQPKDLEAYLASKQYSL